MLNSRMKDFFDLWAISQTFAFDGVVLGDALRATFIRRATPAAGRDAGRPDANLCR